MVDWRKYIPCPRCSTTDNEVESEYNKRLGGYACPGCGYLVSLKRAKDMGLVPSQ